MMLRRHKGKNARSQRKKKIIFENKVITANGCRINGVGDQWGGSIGSESLIPLTPLIPAGYIDAIYCHFRYLYFKN